MRVQNIEFIQDLNVDLLFYLDLNIKDIVNINNGLANCEKGFLLYEEDDDIVPFENLIFWINYSLDLLNCTTKTFGKGKSLDTNKFDKNQIILSLQKLKHQCPKNLFWERQFAKKWL